MNNQTQVIANLLFDPCFLRNDFLFKNLNILHICRVSYSIILFIVYLISADILFLRQMILISINLST